MWYRYETTFKMFIWLLMDPLMIGCVLISNPNYIFSFTPGVGYLTPMSLHAIPVLGQIASSLQTSLRQADAALGGVGSQLARGVGSMKSFIPGLAGVTTGAGCGVAVGYGWGVGLFVSESSMRAAMSSLSSRVGQFKGSSPVLPLKEADRGIIGPAPTISIPSEQPSVPPASTDNDLFNLSKMVLKQQVALDDMEKRLRMLESKLSAAPNVNGGET